MRNCGAPENGHTVVNRWVALMDDELKGTRICNDFTTDILSGNSRNGDPKLDARIVARVPQELRRGDRVRCCLLTFLLCASMSSSSFQTPRTVSSSNGACVITEQSIFGTCSVEKTEQGTLAQHDLTVQGFMVGEATLDEVAHRFPRVKRFRLTREEESSIGICIKNAQGQAVVFASGYAGGWKVLDSVYIAEASTLEKQGATCLAEQSLGSELSTASGIHLGMERDQVLSLLQNTKANGSTFQINLSTSPAKARGSRRRSNQRRVRGG
jgi:hypothetical protein